MFLSAFGVKDADYTFAPPTEGRAHFPSPPTKANSVVFLTRGAAASQGHFFESPSAGHSRFPPSPAQGLSHCPPPASTKGHFHSPPLHFPRLCAHRRRRVQFGEVRMAEILMFNLRRVWCKANHSSAHKDENHRAATLKRMRFDCDPEDNSATLQLPRQHVLNKKSPLCPCTRPGYTKFTRQSYVGTSLQH